MARKRNGTNGNGNGTNGNGNGTIELLGTLKGGQTPKRDKILNRSGA